MSECNHPEPSKGVGSPDYLTLLAERDSAIARAERAEAALERIAAFVPLRGGTALPPEVERVAREAILRREGA